MTSTTTAPPARRWPRVGDIVIYMDQPAPAPYCWGAAGRVPLPAIILRVEDPGNPESRVALVTIGSVRPDIVRVTAYSPEVKELFWSWPDALDPPPPEVPTSTPTTAEPMAEAVIAPEPADASEGTPEAATASVEPIAEAMPPDPPRGTPGAPRGNRNAAGRRAGNLDLGEIGGVQPETDCSAPGGSVS